MFGSVQKFTQEFKDEFCKEVIATSRPIKDVAISYDVKPDMNLARFGGQVPSLMAKSRASRLVGASSFRK